MPTKPTKHKNHGKAYLDEAVAKSTYRRKPITRRRALYGALLGIPFGWMGIHNFALRQKKRGLLHMLTSNIAFLLFFIPFCLGIMAVYPCRHGGECIDISSYDDTLNVLLIIGLIAFVVCIIWGIIESVVILINLNRFPKSTE
jgi:hypothetical protein